MLRRVMSSASPPLPVAAVPHCFAFTSAASSLALQSSSFAGGGACVPVEAEAAVEDAGRLSHCLAFTSAASSLALQSSSFAGGGACVPEEAVAAVGEEAAVPRRITGIATSLRRFQGGTNGSLYCKRSGSAELSRACHSASCSSFAMRAARFFSTSSLLQSAVNRIKNVVKTNSTHQKPGGIDSGPDRYDAGKFKQDMSDAKQDMSDAKHLHIHNRLLLLLS